MNSIDSLREITPQTPILEAALIYSDAGIPVLPLVPPKVGDEDTGKQPLVKGGVHAATRNKTKIRRWWKRWPKANIGIGMPPGYVCLDVDPRNGGEIGDDWPETLTASSGGGGSHLIYRGSVGRKVGKGVDTISPDSKYIVAAPSIHPITGGIYAWHDIRSVADTLPEWKGKPKAEAREGDYTGKYEAEEVAEMLEPCDPDMEYPEWHEVGMAVFMLLGAKGFDVWEMWSKKAILRYEPTACADKWESICRDTRGDFDPVSKLEHLAVKPDAKDEFDDGLEVDPPSGEDLEELSHPVLPDEAIPGILGKIVERACRHSESTRGMVAGTVLSHFSARFGHAMTLRVGDVDHPLNSYMIGIGPTGKGRKGTSSALPKRIFKEVDAALTREEAFKLPRLNVITSFSTGEGLILILSDDDDEFSVKDKRLLAIQSEFSGVLSVSSRDGSTLSEAIRDAYDGEPLQINTKNSPLRAEDYHLCILGHITGEEFLTRAQKTDQANGFLNRFLVFGSYRDKLVAIPIRTPNADVLKLAEKIVGNVKKLFPDGINPFSRREVIMRFNGDAEREWRRRYHELTMAVGSNLSVTKLMGRVELHVMLMAALVAVVNGKREIDLESLTAGYAWVYHSIATLERVFSTKKERTKAKKTRKVEDIIIQVLEDHDGTASLKELHEATKQGENKMTAAARNRVIQVLATGHPPRVKVETMPQKRGRPTTVVTLCNGD